MFEKQYDSYLDVLRRHGPRLLALPNVVGAAVARRHVGLEPTDEFAVQVYVERKVDRGLIPPEHLISADLDGVRTDVCEVDCPHTLDGDTLPARALRQRPYRGGCSIGRSDGVSGTIATICRNTEDNGRRYVLSNHHVLAESDDPRERNKLFQPAAVDGATPADFIGRLIRRARIRYSAMGSRVWNQVDGAIAEVAGDQTDWSIAEIGPVRGINPHPAIGTRVQKSGRTTGHTTGEVVGISAGTMVRMRGSLTYFADQLIVKMEVQHGDSGSLVLDEQRNAVGLLFAATRNFALVNPIDLVQKKLRVNVVAPGEPSVVLGAADDPPADFARALETVRNRLIGYRKGVVGVSEGKSETGTLTIEVRVDDTFEGTLPAWEGAWTVRVVAP